MSMFRNARLSITSAVAIFSLMAWPSFAYAEAGEPAMVRIPGKKYEIGKFEVTQGEWRAVMGNNPSAFGKCGDSCPVERVSWDDAQAFIKKLNAKTGKQYRLPSKAEWEYACQGGGRGKYCGGNDLNAVGWFDGNSNGQTHPVGRKKANGFGLYDMSGNVFEWLQDCYEGGCAKHMICGGAWSNGAQFAEVSFSGGIDATFRDGSHFGFRLARTLPGVQ